VATWLIWRESWVIAEGGEPLLREDIFELLELKPLKPPEDEKEESSEE